MTRISEIKEEFYKKLHAIETPEVKVINGVASYTPTQQSLINVRENDPRILELRRMLGITSSPESAQRKLKRESIDFQKLRIMKEYTGYTTHELATLIGMSDSKFDYRLKWGVFEEDEVKLLEETFGLEEGALIK